jgi:hypothetical protein
MQTQSPTLCNRTASRPRRMMSRQLTHTDTGGCDAAMSVSFSSLAADVTGPNWGSR